MLNYVLDTVSVVTADGRIIVVSLAPNYLMNCAVNVVVSLGYTEGV